MADQARETAPRPRIIERWFPCAEVSAASSKGWGSSNSETLLMSWFAKRPLAQSRAAVLCSLLPWPEDEAEQERVQAIIREALGSCQDPDWWACRDDECGDSDCTRKTHMEQASRAHTHGIVDCARQDPNGGYDAARTDVLRLFDDAYPDRPAEMLDPLSGRGLIPVEAARFRQQAHAIDYSPVATLASRLLIDWPFHDWSAEPPLPFDPPADADDDGQAAFDVDDPQRLVRDIDTVQAEVQRRIESELDEFYPDNDRGEKPWGYVWAQVIPCDGCGREFPLYGSNLLHGPHSTYPDGVSFQLRVEGDGWEIDIVEGVTEEPPTMRARPGKRGKLAWCPYDDCGHAHELPEHKRLVRDNYHRVVLLVVSDLDGTQKTFREPTDADRKAAQQAAEALASMSVNGLPARPDEQIPDANHHTVRALNYGAQTYGDLSIDRQNLLHATIARAIADISDEMIANGNSHDYAAALSGYCSAALVRKLRRSGRASFLMSYSDGRSTGASSAFTNESSLGFNYDSFEVGIAPDGPATWGSSSALPTCFDVYVSTDGRPGLVQRGSVLRLPHRDESLDAVVTDPPYEMMIDYTDASDLFYVWLRRALAGVNPDFAMTAHPKGVQEKSEEVIVKDGYTSDVDEHRTPDFYRRKIAEAFAECRRVVHNDGLVSIVFGHGDPDAWKSLLDAISESGLVLTGAWPANTEAGGHTAGGANIQTTLTLACRPAPPDRPDGRVAEVDAEIRRVVAERVRDVWEPSGLSYVDQKMAAAGPALEIVGRYRRILDKKGREVDLTRYLPLARQAVTDAHDLRFDSLPLETFDHKTRFALEWVRAYGRQTQAASEARWQRLAADLEDHDTEGVLKDAKKGVRLATSDEADPQPEPGGPLIDVALSAAKGWRDGSLADAAAAIRDAEIDPHDQHFWAVVNALSRSLAETDEDGAAWTAMVRNRDAVVAAVENAEAAVRAQRAAEEREAAERERAPGMFDGDGAADTGEDDEGDVLVEDPNSLFGQERDEG